LPFTGTDVVEADRACCPDTPPETWEEAAVLLELAAPGPVGGFFEIAAALAYDNARAGALASTAADVDGPLIEGVRAWAVDEELAFVVLACGAEELMAMLVIRLGGCDVKWEIVRGKSC
jgi:hypothetical protein